MLQMRSPHGMNCRSRMPFNIIVQHSTGLVSLSKSYVQGRSACVRYQFSRSCKRRRLCLQTPRSASEREEERLQTTLSALEAFLGPEAVEGDSGEENISTGIASTSPVSEAVERTAEAPSTSASDDPASKDWRSMSKQELLALGYSKGLSWIKDAVKPTSIIEEDDYLPRAKARFAYIIMLANILVYGIGLSRLTEGPEGPMNYFLSLAEVNEAVEAGEYFRIITASFLHDSFVHLCVSSYALLTIAPEAEAVLGSFAFLTTYLLGGAAGTALCFLLTDTITVGASSGIFGLIGAMGAFLYKNHKAPKSSDGLFAAVGLLAFNLFLGGDHTTTVDNVGHFGGLVCGIYLGVLLSPAVVESPTPHDKTPGSTTHQAAQADGAEGAEYTAAEVAVPSETTPSKALPAEQSKAVDGKPRNVRVLQPNRLQSVVVLACVTVTLMSSVAATVIHRTGELPFPKWL